MGFLLLMRRARSILFQMAETQEDLNIWEEDDGWNKTKKDDREIVCGIRWYELIDMMAQL